MDTQSFQEIIWQKGKELRRDMPWRRDTRPYYVLVSELMLQQTQVDRVVPKFEAFIARFPNEKSLAGSSLGDVVRLWNGLGYNRRAKFLHEAAKKITHEHNGVFPDNLQDLLCLPGVGPGTAGAIAAYAFNQPVVFIETNIRTVYFHHFFGSDEKVSDLQLRALVEQTLDHRHPREFYWALMDYGAWLKKSGVGKITQSRHYQKQSALKGSVREVRGQIVRVLAAGDQTLTDLTAVVVGDERFEPALRGLVRDGLITQTGDIFHLTK
jgi:A/G-specific adenine glycosylase